MERRYIFNASAIGAAARLDGQRDLHDDRRHGGDPTIAASALPVMGGHSQAKKEHFCFSPDGTAAPGVLSVQSAESRTVGHVEEDGSATSVAHCEVRGFSAFGKVHVAEIEARLKSNIRPGPYTEERPFRKSVTLAGSDIRGLRIGNFAFNVRLKDFCCDLPEPEQDSPKEVPDTSLPGKTADVYRLATIVEKIEWASDEDPSVTIDGNTIQWDGYRVFIGEVLLGKKSCGLTMVRVEKSAAQGVNTMSAGSGAPAERGGVSFDAEPPAKSGGASGGTVWDDGGSM